ncbi:MAG TPA: diaminopimelate decarboxylase [Thermomicrobiales bacterium]|nr:diaminopimelate decarboxylase [Thermomicrobiales bacterium]
MITQKQMTHVWPDDTHRNERGEIVVGGVSLVEIAETYGTPVYVYDEATLRKAMRQFREAFVQRLPLCRVVYAGKAFLTTALVRLLVEEDLGLDVVSAGELYVGLSAGMDPSRISLHGNNKTRDELRMALDAGIGKIIVDNFDEIEDLETLCADREEPMTVLLRVNPGVDVHTHKKISTGMADSKFGLPIADGQAARAVERLRSMPGVHLAGYHAHVGSQLFEADASVDAIEEILDFAVDMRARYGVEMEQLSPGGGFGIAYLDHENPPAVEDWADRLASAVIDGCRERGIPMPVVVIEPGRAIAGPAGVAVYRVGARKELPGVRTYVSVDGGMADNIRPALYDAAYTASIANRSGDAVTERVTIAGKYCESGDILIEEIELPRLERDDLLAIPAAGAYCLAMASNYNMSLRPAVVMVSNGEANVIRRRETFDDLLRLENDAVSISDAASDTHRA